MKIEIFKDNEKRRVELKKTGFFSRGYGLTFRTRETKNLLFEMKKNSRVSITSLFVFFPFIVAWLDDDNRILESRVVKPFELRVRPREKFKKFVEIPFNERNKEIINFIVDN